MQTEELNTPLMVWKTVKLSRRPSNEAEIRRATRLGVGTVNRWVRTLVEDGFLKFSADGRKDARSYSTARSEHELIGKYRSLRAGPKPGARKSPSLGIAGNASRPFSLHGEGIGRVASVFDLGAGAAV